MEYIGYVVVAVIAMWIGWHARGIIFLANISQNPDRVINMLEQIKKINAAESQGELDALDSEAVEVALENVSGCWYVYSKDTNQFLAQGNSLEDALLQAATRYPTKKFWSKQTEQFSQTA